MSRRGYFGASKFECFHISSSTLYGVTNLVTEVKRLVTHEESLTLLREATA